METKLTLKLDRDAIEQAKLYARENNLSLSKMVEKYFQALTDDSVVTKKTKLVRELSGVITLDESKNLKYEYSDFLTEKYK